jgi:hypothetical protein
MSNFPTDADLFIASKSLVPSVAMAEAGRGAVGVFVDRWDLLGAAAEDEQRCTLVLIEVNERGKKRLLALALLGLAVEGTARNSADLLR